MLPTSNIEAFTLVSKFVIYNAEFLGLLERNEGLWPSLKDLSVYVSGIRGIILLLAARIGMGHPIHSLHVAMDITKYLNDVEL